MRLGGSLNTSGPLSTAPKARTLRSWTLPGDSGLKLGPRGDKALYDPYAEIMVITRAGNKGSVG
ncbi:hypothetical protein BQ8482_110922 [Mesorhizobium delmotii]|uniref:Uncharacterized protein n=1 Tax=Mesorhizobium delmotii TaxID=1631247 RepID=A0A2P9AD37_9HYPH|nr:hypothetical protein BQ8482_110922 [Mesorhizobium delmotii]